MLYVVKIREELSTDLKIEARTEDEAIANAMEQYYTSEVILDSEHFTGITFEIQEEIK